MRRETKRTRETCGTCGQPDVLHFDGVPNGAHAGSLRHLDAAANARLGLENRAHEAAREDVAALAHDIVAARVRRFRAGHASEHVERRNRGAWIDDMKHLVDEAEVASDHRWREHLVDLAAVVVSALASYDRKHGRAG